MIKFLRARQDELREALRDPGRPMPAWIWFVLAALVSMAFFLWLRLAAVRMAPPARPTPGVTPALRTATGGGAAVSPGPAVTPAIVRPDASERVLGARIEAWRLALVARDLKTWMGFYARTYGAAGEDLAARAERAAHEFSASDPLTVSLSGLAVQAGSEIVTVEFVETRSEGGRETRSRVRMYLLAEGGEWRIFNEERSPIERGSEAP